MNWRSILIIIGILLHPAVSLWAQQDVLRFHDVSVADALTTINEHYPGNSIHFVRNELDTLLLSNVSIKGQDVLDDITRVIGQYPIGLKIFGNHIFVEYRREKLLFGNIPQMILSEEDDIAFARILHEVMVSHTYPLLDMTGSVMSLHIADTPLAVAGSAFDLLHYLPGVLIDAPGTVIRIDGKTVTSYSELTELDSEEVERIDYTDQLQYSSRQKTIIDIRTNRKREDGYGIHMASQFSQGERGRAMQLVKTNVHQGKWDLQASGTYRYDGIQKDISINQGVFKDSYEHNSFHLNLASEYSLSKQLTFGLQYQLLTMLNPVRQKRDNLIFDYDPSNMLWANNEANVQNMQRIREWQLDYRPINDLNMYVRSSLGKWTVNAAASLYRDAVNLSELNVTDFAVDHRYNEVQNSLWDAKAEASRQLWHGQLRLMTEYSGTKRKDIYHRSDTVPDASLLRLQRRWSGNIAYLKSIGRTEGNIGLLLEHVETYTDFQRVFPFANVNFLGSKAKLSLAYAMRSAMPTYGQTSGFAYHNIEMLGVEGEPGLNPSLIHQLQMKVQAWDFYGSIEYQKVTDYIAQSIESKNEEFMVNYHNVDAANLYNAMLSYHHSLNHWTSQYAITFHGQDIEDGGKPFNKPVYGLQWNNQLQLPHGITAMLNAAYRSSGHEGTTWQVRTGQVGLSLTKEAKNWTLQLKAEDIFHTGTTRIIYYGKDSEYCRRCYADNQRIQLTLRINLGSLSRKKLTQPVSAGQSERRRF